jgi:hypothetical protein
MLALLGVIAFGGRAAHAQTPSPQTITPGPAAIWTDKPQYAVGDTITYCYTIPYAGQITVTDIPSDGNGTVIYAGPSGTQGCQTGVVIPPTGTECLRLTYPLSPGTGVAQTCFQVVGSSPPPPTSSISISTNRTSYQVGDPIQVCYYVPGPGYVTINNVLPNGVTLLYYSAYDYGTGGCVPGEVAPPAGTACMTLAWSISNPTGGAPPTGQAQTCYQVQGTPPSSSGFVQIGSAAVQANGTWAFYKQIVPPQPGMSFVRVTSGTCDASPSLVAVWDGNMSPQPSNGPNMQVFDGNLYPVGYIGGTATSGYGFISRPIIPNPPTDVSIVLYGIPAGYQGIILNVCIRTP